MREIRIGTRGSVLAVAQAKIIADKIAGTWPGVRIEIVKITTSGDRNMSPFSSDPAGIKGMFTLELERALIDGKIDVAVHSLKDLPANMNPELVIGAYSRRGDPRDVLVARGEGLGVSKGLGVSGMPRVIGSSSLRRRLQLARLFPESEIVPVRGNVTTRLRNLDDGEVTGLVLAAAGLERIGLSGRIARVFGVDEVMPAPGQGILACQVRRNGDYGYLECVDDPDSRDCGRAERSFARELGAGCNVPVGAYAEVDGERLRLRGLYVDDKGRFLRGEVLGVREKAEELGKKLAEVIMA